MTKHEARMTKEARIPNDELPRLRPRPSSSSSIPDPQLENEDDGRGRARVAFSFVIRASSFVTLSSMLVLLFVGMGCRKSDSERSAAPTVPAATWLEDIT